MRPGASLVSNANLNSNPITQALTAAHRNMERVLTLIHLKLDTLHETQQESKFQLLTNAISYMQNYPGVSHHPTEDIIVAKLAERAPEHRGFCTQLSDQHQRFSRWEIIMLHKLRGAQAGDAEACREVQAIGKSYCTEHASHIHTEEKELFPRALQFLNAADWDTVADHSRAALDPVFARKELRRFDTLHDYLMAGPADPEPAG